MTTIQLIALDHVVALLGVAAWFAASVTAAVRRTRLAVGLLAAAGLLWVARGVTVGLLAGSGWWFVQEKVLLGLPILTIAGLAAGAIATPSLLAAKRTQNKGITPHAVLALFTAAYASAAGLAVTLLTGYPLTWSTALIAVALVCVGSLLTARVLAAPVEQTAANLTDNAVLTTASASEQAPAPDQSLALALAMARQPEFSRRRFLGWAGGAVAVGAGGAGTGLLFSPGESITLGGGPDPSPASHTAISVTELRGARTPAPGGTKQQHVLAAEKATVRLPSGQLIDALTFNGRLPGPAITATEGDLIEVRLRNTDIEDGVTLHWHGYDLACGEDGAPGTTQDAVTPGKEFVYRFRADQVGTYWYHTHQASHHGVRKGLYGTLVVRPREDRQPAEADEELDLTLPVHTFDNAVVMGNRLGRTEHTASPGTRVRLRLVNTDSDPHWFALTGTPFRVAAVDGRDLHEPGEVRNVRLRLPAGGRYDLVLTMPETPAMLVLDNDTETGVRLRPDGTGAAGEKPAAVNTAGWPELDLLHYGTPTAVPFDAGQADRHFTIVLDRGVAMVDGRPAYAQTVNGRGHPSIPDQLVREGDIVRFTVVNRSLETHPWHLHGHPVLVLSRDGTPSSGSPLWMDTFDVRPGEVWEVAFQATNPGIWMNHCHNLPHAHEGMMLRLAYDDVTTPFDGSHLAHTAGNADSPM